MKSTAGFILALIGGILGILGAIITFVMGLGTSMIPIPGLAAWGTGFLVGWGIWVLIMSILAIVAGLWMNKDDNAKVKKGGIMALVVGILGLNILTLIGGIIGLVQANK